MYFGLTKIQNNLFIICKMENNYMFWHFLKQQIVNAESSIEKLSRTDNYFNDLNQSDKFKK
jgi:hypothetical protein